MVIGFMGRKGRKELGAGHNRGRGGVVDTGLPVHETTDRGENGDSDLRRLEQAMLSLMPVQDGKGPDERAGTDSDAANHRDGGELCTGDQRDGADSERSEQISIQGTGNVVDTQFAYVPNGHRKTFEEAIAELAEPRVRERDDVLSEQPTERFERVFTKALIQTEETLDLELPHPSDPDYAKILSLKQTAATAVINSGLKADENRLRRKQTDVLAKLYATVEQKKLQMLEAVK